MASELQQTVGPKKKKNAIFAININSRYHGLCSVACTQRLSRQSVEVAVMSGASLYIKKDLKMTDVQLEILMGIVNLYSILGSFAAGRTSDWIGRRYTVVFIPPSSSSPARCSRASLPTTPC